MDGNNENLAIEGFIRPCDIEGFEDGIFAVYAHNSGNTYVCKFDEKISFVLTSLSFEIFTVVKIENSFAPIGLVDKFNSGGTIECVTVRDKKQVIIKDGGILLMYVGNNPENIFVNDEKHEFIYDEQFVRLTINSKGAVCVDVN